MGLLLVGGRRRERGGEKEEDGQSVEKLEVDRSVPIFDKGKMKIMEHGRISDRFIEPRRLGVSFICRLYVV